MPPTGSVRIGGTGDVNRSLSYDSMVEAEHGDSQRGNSAPSSCPGIKLRFTSTVPPAGSVRTGGTGDVNWSLSYNSMVEAEPGVDGEVHHALQVGGYLNSTKYEIIIKLPKNIHHSP